MTKFHPDLSKDKRAIPNQTKNKSDNTGYNNGTVIYRKRFRVLFHLFKDKRLLNVMYIPITNEGNQIGQRKEEKLVTGTGFQSAKIPR